jgi:hypothetical protein
MSKEDSAKIVGEKEKKERCIRSREKGRWENNIELK